MSLKICKVFNNNLHNIALKSSFKDNIPLEIVAEKDKIIQQKEAQIEKERLEKEKLVKEIQEIKKNAEKEKVFQYIEQGQKIAEVAEHVEKYYVKIVKDLKEYINKTKRKNFFQNRIFNFIFSLFKKLNLFY